MTNVYWTSDDAVLQMPLGGGAATTIASMVTAENIAVDAQYVYSTDGFFTGGEKKVPIGGGPLKTHSDGQSGPGFVAVDATSVYWTTLNSIKKAPK